MPRTCHAPKQPPFCIVRGFSWRLRQWNPPRSLYRPFFLFSSRALLIHENAGDIKLVQSGTVTQDCTNAKQKEDEMGGLNTFRPPARRVYSSLYFHSHSGAADTAKRDWYAAESSAHINERHQMGHSTKLDTIFINKYTIINMKIRQKIIHVYNSIVRQWMFCKQQSTRLTSLFFLSLIRVMFCYTLFKLFSTIFLGQ